MRRVFCWVSFGHTQTIGPAALSASNHPEPWTWQVFASCAGKRLDLFGLYKGSGDAVWLVGGHFKQDGAGEGARVS